MTNIGHIRTPTQPSNSMLDINLPFQIYLSHILIKAWSLNIMPSRNQSFRQPRKFLALQPLPFLQSYRWLQKTWNTLSHAIHNGGNPRSTRYNIISYGHSFAKHGMWYV